MKLTIKSFITVGLLAFTGHIFSAEINFEFWNKHNDPVYYNVAHSMGDIQKTNNFKVIRPGKWVQDSIDLSKPTIIALKINKQPASGDILDTYTIVPHKKLIIRIGLPAEKEKFKETLKSIFNKTSIEADGYIFGPQTGPLLGFRAASGIFFDWGTTVNERGLLLNGNLTKDDITKGSIVYLPQ